MRHQVAPRSSAPGPNGINEKGGSLMKCQFQQQQHLREHRGKVHEDSGAARDCHFPSFNLGVSQYERVWPIPGPQHLRHVAGIMAKGHFLSIRTCEPRFPHW